jgi:hypothetical protein
MDTFNDQGRFVLMPTGSRKAFGFAGALSECPRQKGSSGVQMEAFNDQGAFNRLGTPMAVVSPD